MFGQLVAAKRAEQGLSFKKAAQLCQVSDALLVGIEKYNHTPKPGTCEKIIKGLRINPEAAWQAINRQLTPQGAWKDLLDQKGLMPIPIVSRVKDGKLDSTDFLTANDLSASTHTLEHLPALADSKMYGLHVYGNSMEPVFRNGDRIFADPDKELSNGQYIVVHFADKEAFIRRYYRNENTIILQDIVTKDPPQFVTAEETQAIHAIVFHKMA